MGAYVPDACAIGGCVKGYVQPAHTASAVGEVAAENIFNQEAHYANPTCVYMEPEAASMGLTEEVCKAQGFSYKMGKFPLTANGKSLILNGDEDLVKIIAGVAGADVTSAAGSSFSDVDAGAWYAPYVAWAAENATDLIGRGTLAIGTGCTVDEIIVTIHSHATVTESICETASTVEKRAIHIKN